ncbi:ribosome maturation factor RimP [Blochmannia endosymbiont of Colobopsis nipponica]|uniref:ribosome maturation factor RimP n=1 Tax=Blochmannia endosymbiont of Colobopsis nipponica TaxID=2681987 RepID=UPI0017828D93|nr:ribosome maturation factor RimP [Blochmannia endosymbiont of Colobopsis nipponica]QOI10756.1 ribosome maturation factor RimP [Blochmannia endosymbiont of Colobopsis nipponica]
MTLKKKLEDIVVPSILVAGCELVGIEVVRGRRIIIRIYVDKKHGGVTINDCAVISRKVGCLLDSEDIFPVSYNLEVSSPGFDRPLFSYAHFVQFIGFEVNLVLHFMLYGRRRWRGIIKRATEDGSIILTVDNKEVHFMIDDIQKANLVAHS